MNEFPKRKQIRLKDYDYSQNGYYFVTICTYNRQRLFKISDVTDDLYVVASDMQSNKIIEKWLVELENKYSVNIKCYIIMPDHIHFILNICNKQNVVNEKRQVMHSLHDMLQWFKTMTTNEYIRNVKDKKIKPFNIRLWQKSYYEHIIRNETEYSEKVEYILSNPLRWNNRINL